MSPPKTLKKRIVDPPRVASPSPAAAAPTVARQLGNGQMRTLLQARQAKASDAPSRDRSAEQGDVDAWSTLSAGGQARARALYGQCMDLIGRLNDAQTAHVSSLRRTWINFLAHNVLVRISNLDSDEKINSVANVLEDHADVISRNVATFDAEWQTVEYRALDERGWLLRQGFDDATLAAARIESLYSEAKGRLDAGAMSYITDEDYADLKRTLDKRTYISTGVLQGSRIRAHEIHDLLEVVRELRLDDQDPDKYAPGWRKSVDAELDHLDQLAKRTPATPGTDFAAEFTRLRNELREQRDAVLQKRPLAERVAVGIAKVPIAGAKAVVGAAEAIVGPFVEAARELFDEAQIGLYYVSGGRYMPKLTSDLMKAFEQGATRTDVLKGLVKGLIGTPKRLLDAVEDGDWEAVGREAMNLYLLAKLVKESPQYLSRVPEFLAMTRRAFRALRARTLQLRLNSPRLTPEIPRYGPTTEPGPLPDEPAMLLEPPTATVAALRDHFLRMLRTGGRDNITVERVGFGGVQAWVGEGGVLTVYRDLIINADRIPDQGKLMHAAFEQAAKDAARLSGSTRVRVAVGSIQNQKWAAYLRSVGYDWDMIPTPHGHSQALVRALPL